MWVDRVRPKAWDAFIADNSLLSTLSSYEIGEGNVLTITDEDIESLQAHGMTLLVLDAKLFPRTLMGLVPNLAKVYTNLFGQPIYRGDQLRVWSIDNWSGKTLVELPIWTLSSNATLGDGRHKMPDPVDGRGVR